ncbi:unnamed protein product [Coffea canephora]|uniref:Uncharacterized protein n=1 Tax=Coffea canephora TaxID=49390 RepID=A0A068UZJ0_COFCA|nr:unnamed protein product [Coffea canephora]
MPTKETFGHLKIFLLSTLIKPKPKRSSCLVAQPSDICIGTSAAPTYLPGHYFWTRDGQANVQEFNLIDGDVVANPTKLGTIQVTKKVLDQNPDFFSIEAKDFGHFFLVISLGSWHRTGNIPTQAQDSILFLDVFTQASADMVDICMDTEFRQHILLWTIYLRIQDDTLIGTESWVGYCHKRKTWIEIGGEIRENLSTGEGSFKCWLRALWRS